jgi:hypothetical protein
MTQEKILGTLNKYIEDGVDCFKLRRVKEYDNATFYVGHSDTDGMGFGLIVYDDTDPVYDEPLMFYSYDWALEPPTVDEVATTRWICAQNKCEGIMFNGLPHLDPWTL